MHEHKRQNVLVTANSGEARKERHFVLQDGEAFFCRADKVQLYRGMGAVFSVWVKCISGWQDIAWVLGEAAGLFAHERTVERGRDRGNL